eukprot:7953947-Pyramimonas_sp.AAC.1
MVQYGFRNISESLHGGRKMVPSALSAPSRPPRGPSQPKTFGTSLICAFSPLRFQCAQASRWP